MALQRTLLALALAVFSAACNPLLAAETGLVFPATELTLASQPSELPGYTSLRIRGDRRFEGGRLDTFFTASQIFGESAVYVIRLDGDNVLVRTLVDAVLKSGSAKETVLGTLSNGKLKLAKRFRAQIEVSPQSSGSAYLRIVGLD